MAPDAAWALSQLLQKCTAANAWALDAGAPQQVQRTLMCSNGEGLDSLLYLAHSFGGLGSIMALLKELFDLLF